MNFEWSAEQEALRTNVRRFLDEQGPRGPLAELGLAGLLVPEALGGAGLGMLEMGVVLEEAGRALHAAPFLASALGATRLLLAAASSAEQQALLPALASGERRAALALFEPGSRGAWDLPETHVRANRLHGAKSLVLEAADADLLLVVARAGEVPGVFAVERDAPGATLAPLECLDPTRPLFELQLDGAPAKRLGSGDARAAVDAVADALAAGLVADGVGAAGRALERALAYAREREQFGRPIGSFQAVQHLLVDMLQSLELVRAASAYALWAQDAAPAAERARATALAKAAASEALPRIGADAIQVFGGIGFTSEIDLHRYYRRLVSGSLLHGDADHHLARLAENVLPALGAPR